VVLAVAITAMLLCTIFSTMMFVKGREARASEARLRKDTELGQKASQCLLLATQRRFEEADKLLADLPLEKPALGVSAQLRALVDWQATKGR
jgi:hypothetical protein